MPRKSGVFAFLGAAVGAMSEKPASVMFAAWYASSLAAIVALLSGNRCP